MLSPAQRKYLIVDQIIASSLFNIVFNGWLGWQTFRHFPAVPLRGNPSIAGDGIATAVLLPLLTCVIVTPLVRRAVRHGKVPPLKAAVPGIDMVLWLPRWSFLRGLVLAVLCLAWLAPLYLGPLLLLGVQAMSLSGFVFIKAVYSGVMAALVSPVIALYALATMPRSEASASDDTTLASVFER